jgi:hypothetical protein
MFSVNTRHVVDEWRPLTYNQEHLLFDTVSQNGRPISSMAGLLVVPMVMIRLPIVLGSGLAVAGAAIYYVRRKQQADGTTGPAYTLYYWPIPGRGIFIRSLFAYAAVPYTDAPVEDVIKIKSAPFAEQAVPLRAPPFLVDHTAGTAATISQTEAVAVCCDGAQTLD